MQEKTAIKDYIEFRNGEAVIVGHGNLKAEYVARRHVNGGDSIDDVMAHYGLSRAEVHAALTYYYENQAILDAAMDDFWAEVKSSDSTVDNFRAEIESRRRSEHE